MLDIHPSARISPLCDIEDSVRGSRITIAENAVIDAFVKIKPAGGNGDLYIGANSIVNSGCVFYTGNGVYVGHDVAIAANCTFAPVNHEYADKNRLIRQQGFRPSKGGIRIGNDVWIGASCVLLDGTVIGDGCVIGAGCLVRGELTAYAVYGGNPLRVLGQRQ